MDPINNTRNKYSEEKQTKVIECNSITLTVFATLDYQHPSDTAPASSV